MPRKDDSLWLIRRAICWLAMFVATWQVLTPAVRLSCKRQTVLECRTYLWPPDAAGGRVYREVTDGYGWPFIVLRVTEHSTTTTATSQSLDYSVAGLLGNLGLLAIPLAGTWSCLWRWARSAKPWQFGVGPLLAWTGIVAILLANGKYLADCALLHEWYGYTRPDVAFFTPLLLGIGCTLFTLGRLAACLLHRLTAASNPVAPPTGQ